MMKILFKFSILALTSILLSSCGGGEAGRYKDTKTGWNFNDPDYGNYLKGDPKAHVTPPGMVMIEGGTYTMGAVQDDVMFDWNVTPRQMHVRSFYLDETEVTNAEYSMFLQYMKAVYPPDKYKHIYNSILPDTLAWRRSLGNTGLLADTYFRIPAYSEYPVVGVSWIQATQYCKWRTNAVNLKKLMDIGVVKNVFQNDSLGSGSINFDTEAYLANPNALFKGDSTVYGQGIPIPGQQEDQLEGGFSGRHVNMVDGILAQEIRLPTESEWEYAAKAAFENREYNIVRGRKKYSWNAKYTRNTSQHGRGDQMANFKQAQGNYSGIAGWSSDGADIPNSVKSYPPNAFGLYDMSGNVAEWVQDVYRPIVDSEANDFNYFRGNTFTRVLIDENGKTVFVGEGEVEYDTLINGMVIPKDLPGTVKHIPVTKDDLFYRRNYNRADNINLHDGDLASSINYERNQDELEGLPRMYNSPLPPAPEIDSLGNETKNEYDKKARTTLISDASRVYKGGSWADREYWLDPAQRRYFPQYISTSYIGFRCATDKVGPMRLDKRKRPTPKKR